MVHTHRAAGHPALKNAPLQEDIRTAWPSRLSVLAVAPYELDSGDRERVMLARDMRIEDPNQQPDSEDSRTGASYLAMVLRAGCAQAHPAVLTKAWRRKSVMWTWVVLSVTGEEWESMSKMRETRRVRFNAFDWGNDEWRGVRGVSGRSPSPPLPDEISSLPLDRPQPTIQRSLEEERVHLEEM